MSVYGVFVCISVGLLIGFSLQWAWGFWKETKCRGTCWDLGTDASTLKSYKECVKQCLSS